MDGGQTTFPVTVPLFHLHDGHAQLLVRVFRRILATNTAERSFAMLMDGRLTIDELKQCRFLRMDDDRDEIKKYTGPTHESITMFHSLREQFEPSHVLLKASIAEKFQRSVLGPPCRDFKAALLGLVASMIHDLAVSVFEHLHGSKYSNRPHEGDERPVLPDFRHPKYVGARSYPRGPIELVGYWMEVKIFGGVVVFEHGNPPGEPGAPWIHLPYRGIIRLPDVKLDEFTELAFSERKVSSVLPFARDPSTHVIASYYAYDHGLFRNEFEHVPPPNITRFPCVRRDVTYPEELLEELRRS